MIQQFIDNPDIRQSPLPFLRCPSDDYPALGENDQAVTNYGPSVGAQATFSWQNSCPEPRGNEFGTGDDLHAYTHLKDATSGIFSRIVFAASIPQIPDGTSKTIAMGEVLPTAITN